MPVLEQGLGRMYTKSNHVEQTFRRITLFLCGFAMVCSLAQELKKPVRAPSSKKDTVFHLDTLNVQGDEFYTPFIWNQMDFDDSTSVKQDFAHEEFFMRNIDREEFEEERALLQFLGQDGNEGLKRKKAIWTPFPDRKAATNSENLQIAPSSTPSH